MDGSALAVAERLFRAIEAADIDAVAALYAPDAVIWHNYDDREQTAAENVAVLRRAVAAISGMRYEDVRRSPTPRGFVQQHVLRGTAPDGGDLRVPGCIVCAVKDGLITRLDEYLDPAAFAALRPR